MPPTNDPFAKYREASESMDGTVRDYEDDLGINIMELAEECLEQSQRYGYYAKELAYARRRRDRANERVKTIRSEKVREAKAGTTWAGKSPTGQMVEAYYRTNEEYVAAKEDAVEREFEVHLMEAAVYAFAQRRDSLEYLVRLGLGEWYAGPPDIVDLSDWQPKKIRRAAAAQKERKKIRKPKKKMQRGGS